MWDRRHGLTAWQQSTQGLMPNICSTRGLCGVLRAPINGVDLVAVVACAVLLGVSLLLRRPRTACVFWAALAYLSFGFLRPVVKLDDPERYSYQRPAQVPAVETSNAAWDCPSVAYVPGKLERVWLRGDRHVVAGRICQLNNGSANLAATREHWLEYARQQRLATVPHATRKSIAASDVARAHSRYAPLRPLPPTTAQLSQLSRFVGGQPIEPLTGVARHPLAKGLCYDGADATVIMNLEYLLLANGCDTHGRPAPRCAQTSPPPRNIFFDLGCTVYDDEQPLDEARGSGAGPSLPLFFRLYERRCIVFDELYGWEATRHDQAVWWRRVPAAMRPRIRFYNVPVYEGSMVDALSGRVRQSAARSHDAHGTPTSFLHVLNATATVDDFVVVKVDIDHGPEMQVVHALAKVPELAVLVDELFFEAHFYFDGIEFGWGDLGADRRNTVDDALALMRRLRERGIRSHFWI